MEEARYSLDTINAALTAGYAYLLANMLPSQWTSTGKGWQQLWEAGDSAGFYASCEGVLLMGASAALAPNISKSIDARGEISELVFTQHLLPVLDEVSFEADTEDKRRMRVNCLSTTLKISRFLQAASVDKFRHINPLLISTLIEMLEAEGKARGGAWTPYFKDPRKSISIASTAEALIALHSIKPGSQVIGPGVEVIKKKIKDLRSKRQPNYDELSVAIWALSNFPQHLTETDLNLVKSISNDIVNRGLHYAHSYHNERFKNPYTGFDDYYTFNTSLLFCHGICNLVMAEFLPISALTPILEVIAHVATVIKKNGFFINPVNDNCFFWEHFQAMSLLLRNVDLAEKQIHYSGGSFMYVNPTHFQKHDFVKDDKLVVVLMPFGPEWSNEIFNAFKEPLEAKGFHVWRSDLHHRDDNIMQTIWDKINSASFVVADCTDKNPNVFYELGIAHTIGKPVFICAQEREDIPFDLAHIRSVTYGKMEGQIGNLMKRIEDLKDRLKKFTEGL